MKTLLWLIQGSMYIAHFGFEKKNKAHQGKVYCCPDQIPYFVEILEKTRSTTT